MAGFICILWVMVTPAKIRCHPGPQLSSGPKAITWAAMTIVTFLVNCLLLKVVGVLHSTCHQLGLMPVVMYGCKGPCAVLQSKLAMFRLNWLLKALKQFQMISKLWYERSCKAYEGLIQPRHDHIYSRLPPTWYRNPCSGCIEQVAVRFSNAWNAYDLVILCQQWGM